MNTKKQIILIASIAAVVIVASIVYFVAFGGDEEPQKTTDTYYVFTKVETEAVGSLGDAVIWLPASKEYYEKTGNEYEKHAQLFAASLEDSCDNVKVEYAPDTFKTKFGSDSKEQLAITVGEKSKVLGFDTLYLSLKDGTRYAFDRGAIVNAVLELSGKSALEGKFLKAMSGYDTDGDTVSPYGYPFMFPAHNRDDIQYIVIENSHGGFTVFRDNDGTLVFKEAMLVSYDDELFASLVVACTYPATNGKVKDRAELSEYGLDSDENATATMTFITKKEEVYKVLIGKKLSSGSGYYAKLDGKDFVYVLSTSVESTILAPLNTFLEANLVYNVSGAENIASIDKITVNYHNLNTELKFTLLDEGEDEGVEYKSLWKLISPSQYIPDGATYASPSANSFGDFMQSISSLTGESVVEYDLTEYTLEDGTVVARFSDELLKKYKLDNPRFEIEYYYKDKEYGYETCSRVFISEKDYENNVYYVYSYITLYDEDGTEVRTFSTGVIATLTYANVKWLNWEPIDFTSESLLSMYLADIQKITLEYGEKSYVFDITADPAADHPDILKVLCNGTQEVELLSFKYLYQNLIRCYRTGEMTPIDTDSATRMMRMKFEYTGGEKEVIFYRVSDKKAYYTVNGEGKRYMLVDNLFIVQDKLEAMLRGELIRD